MRCQAAVYTDKKLKDETLMDGKLNQNLLLAQAMWHNISLKSLKSSVLLVLLLLNIVIICTLSLAPGCMVEMYKGYSMFFLENISLKKMPFTPHFTVW